MINIQFQEPSYLNTIDNNNKSRPGEGNFEEWGYISPDDCSGAGHLRAF